MDFFDSRYYSLSRKSLLLIGQWPYEDQPARIMRHIFVAIVIISATTVQLAKLFTSKNNLSVVVELLLMQIINVICVIKYWVNHSKRKELKMLLEKVKRQWKTLTEEGDHKVLNKFAERGRKHSLLCMLYLYSGVILSVTTIGSQPILIEILQINMTTVMLCPAEYFVDHDKYFYLILLHMTIVVFILATIIVASDTLLILFLYHACGMYETVSFRIEHAFDKCEEIETWRPDQTRLIYKKISDVVKCHKTATEFKDNIMSIFGLMMTLTIIPLALNFSLALYVSATCFNEFNRVVTSFSIGVCQLVHLVVLVIPCQKIVDYSSAISFKAYCSQWYVVPARLQRLVLPIIQRCAKPDTLIAGKMLPLTMEYFAAGLQTSLSYFMMLLSFK